MCGIVGIVAAPGAPPPSEAVGRAMNAAITHRGPDDEGIFCDAQALIGMRRLSIIDLAGGHQPVHNEDGTVQAVFNGEIYNFRELRAELEGRGHRFYTHSDTEVIVHGYEEWGDGCFARLDGMFGLALWDTRTRTLVLARDRFGEKPLFWVESGGQLAFASELKSLLQVPGFRGEIDPAAVRAYVCFGYVPTPGSIFRGVNKLLPGHFLRFVDGKATQERYYTLALGPKHTLSEADAEEELVRLLDQAVESRLVSDVPFGAFLSGGLDSSVVVALMSRHLAQPVRTFSIGFREEAYNELSDARRVAQHLGTEHHELVVEPDAVALLQDLVWYLDEPFADASAVPTYLVAKLARQHVKMVLTGDAGDEAFAGYDRYLRFLDLERVGALKPAAAATAGLVGRLVPGAQGYRLRRIAERLRLPFPDSYLSGVALTRADVADALLGAAVRPDGGGHYGSLATVVRAAANLEPLDRVVAIDFGSYLPDDILV
jgi:asparagine synthase (glutamine-hydrolysing)